MNPSKWMMFGALAMLACRDLDFPEGDEAVNAAPEVSFLSPAANDVVTLEPIVSVDARDPNGVADVTLYCGGVPIYVWTAPPYLSNVDLSSCPSSGSSAIRDIELRAIARDVLGLASAPITLTVRVDVSVAQLTVNAPQRVAPGAALVVRVTSDRTLGAIPSVRIGSTSAAVNVREDLQTQPLTVFDATFTALPGLGTDLYDGGAAEIPLEVLEELERPLLVEVEGRATSGNLSRVVTQVLLSRIAWERALPIAYTNQRFSDDTAEPVADAEGITLPVGIDPRYAHDRWVTVRLAHADGKFTPFPRADLSRSGWQGEALDDQGRLLMTHLFFNGETTETEQMFLDPRTGAELSTPVVYTLGRGTNLRRVAGALCALRERDAGFCGTDVERFMECVSPAGTVTTPTVSSPGDSSSGTAFSEAVSGGTVARAGFFESCSQQFVPVVLTTVSGGSATIPQDVAGDPDPAKYPSALFALAPNTFAASASYPQQSISNQTFVINADGTRGPSFFPTLDPVAAGFFPTGVGPSDILTGRPDGTLVTIRHDNQTTVLEQWRPNEDVPAAAVRLTGFYVGSGDGEPKPRDIVFGSDGSMAVLLVAAESNDGSFKAGSGVTLKPTGRDVVVGIDPQFRVRWLFRPEASADGLLIGDGASSHLYYLDEVGQRITALTR